VINTGVEFGRRGGVRHQRIRRRCGSSDSRQQTIDGMLNEAFTMTRQSGEAKITHFGHDSNQDSSPRGFIKTK
jgi:hypothetical protein